MSDTTETTSTSQPDEEKCFAIMPISNVDGYEDGHFKHVYDDLIAPACGLANYKAFRADDVTSSSHIHLEILRELIDAPMAICDLSTRNPNVLFELGIRQAFNKPVVLIQEEGTPKIFDISPIRYLEYSKKLKYRDVLQKQEELSKWLMTTREAYQDGTDSSSIISLLGLQNGASVPHLDTSEQQTISMQIIQSELRSIKELIASPAGKDFADEVKRKKKSTSAFQELNFRFQALVNHPNMDWGHARELYDDILLYRYTASLSESEKKQVDYLQATVNTWLKHKSEN